jgi:hypothetical protein
VAQVWQLVSDLKEAGAYIYDFRADNVCMNEQVANIPQGFLWVSFKDPDWRAFKAQSFSQVMRQLAQRLFATLHHSASPEYRCVFAYLVEQFRRFRQIHVHEEEFPSVAVFSRQCLQDVLEEYTPAVAVPPMVSVMPAMLPRQEAPQLMAAAVATMMPQQEE